MSEREHSPLLPSALLGLADQGIYASLAYLVIAINMVVAALSVSVTTRLARLFADGDHRQFVRLLTKLSMLGVLIAAVGVPLTFLVGRPLLTLLYRREYADHVGLLALLRRYRRSHYDWKFPLLRSDCGTHLSGPGSDLLRANGDRGGGGSVAHFSMGHDGRRCGATSLYVDNGVRRWVGVTPCCQGGVAREWLTLLCSSTCSLYVMASTCSLSQIENVRLCNPAE
jgi:hypothetical protein